MGVTQMIHGYEGIYSYNQVSCESSSVLSLLAVVAGFLDTALRMWDDDCIQAKSRVKIATEMLRGCTDEAVADAKDGTTPRDRRVLVPWQIRTVKEFIDASLGSTIRLEDCASKARLSAGYFSCAFKATFGTTVRKYIRQRRIERAQQLMLLTNERLARIALACGFSDQAHYCRVFRSVVGLSPNAWRRRNLNLAPHELMTRSIQLVEYDFVADAVDPGVAAGFEI